MPSILKNALLVCASLLFCLGLIEAVLRILGLSFPVFTRADDELGWSYWPNLSGWSVHEATALVSTNDYGFRDSAWSVEKDAGTYRVAILGDSFVESSNVAHQYSLPAIVQSELADCPALSGRAVEAMNFGVSGYGTSQQYLLLENIVFPFSPDFVVLGFYNGNDVADNVAALSEGHQKLRPFHHLNGIELSADDSFRSTGDYDAFRRRTRVLGRIVNQLYLFQFLKQIAVGRLAWPNERELQEHRYSLDLKQPQPPTPKYRAMFSPPADDLWQEAWAVTEALLVAIEERVKSAGAQFLIATIPSPLQVFPDQHVRAEIQKEGGLADLDYPDNRLTALAEREGLPLLTLAQPIREQLTNDALFLHGWPPQLGAGHWNESGNAMGGSLIAEHICARLRGADAEDLPSPSN